MRRCGFHFGVHVWKIRIASGAQLFPVCLHLWLVTNWVAVWICFSPRAGGGGHRLPPAKAPKKKKHREKIASIPAPLSPASITIVNYWDALGTASSVITIFLLTLFPSPADPGSKTSNPGEKRKCRSDQINSFWGPWWRWVSTRARYAPPPPILL